MKAEELMIDVTIEEKARAYDKAIEKIKYVMEHGVQPVLTKEDLQSIFPELQESEDEKVKRIIHSISNKISFHLHDIFTEEEFQCFDAWSNAWLEKQGKPKWTDEDEKRLQSCISELQGKGLMGGVDTIDTKWLKSLKQRMEEQQ